MGTPFISLLEPTRLDGYDRSKSQAEQSAHIPKVFCDAMEVRETVFVREQKVPLEYEHDTDDARSCHWVMYASVNRTTEPEQRDPATGEVLRPRQSKTATVPIGTMRVVPFPHPPHPPDGGVYIDNLLQDRGTKEEEQQQQPQNYQQQQHDEERQQAAMPFGTDRATRYHDGKEPYVKIGRMAVIPEFRGHNISGQLWVAARTWLEQNPTYFNPSIKELGMDQMKIDAPDDIPEWKGLVCCHAQQHVTRVYEKWGFQVDDKMGTWQEEGIPHVGMFLRLDIKK